MNNILKKGVNKISQIARYFVFSLMRGRTLKDKVFVFYLLVRLFIHDYFYSLYVRLPVPRRIVLQTEEGYPFYFDVSADITFSVILSEVFVYGEYDVHVPNTPNTILDIGANVGITTAYFALKYPNAAIHSFEPSPHNYSLLKQNALQFDNVTIYQKALYSHEGSLKLSICEGSEGMNSVFSKTDNIEVVACTTLDKFLAEHKIEHVDILKIDVEGSEWEILRNSSAINKVSVMIGELHFLHIDKDAMLSLLQKHFRVELNTRCDPHNSSCSEVFRACCKES